MTDLTLAAAFAAATPTDGGLRYPVPENWAQGRTAYGGFSAAMLLDAARRGQGDLPPLRSALINFTAPVSGQPVVGTELLRQGRNVTTINARARDGQAVTAQGTFSFGAAQDSHVSAGCPAPEAGRPEDTEPFLPPHVPRPPARFFENFDVRLIAGHRPFVGADRGHTRVWARHHDVESRDTIEGLLCIADLLPPAVFPMLTRIGPNSSMNWICNFLSERPDTRDGWWMIETDLTAAQDGYSSQVMRIWNTDGDLVVEGMQSVIVFV